MQESAPSLLVSSHHQQRWLSIVSMLVPLVSFGLLYLPAFIMSFPVAGILARWTERWLAGQSFGNMAAVLVLAIGLSAAYLGVIGSLMQYQFLRGHAPLGHVAWWLLLSAMGAGCGVALAATMLIPLHGSIKMLITDRLTSWVVGSIAGGLGGGILGGAQAVMFWRHAKYALGWMLMSALGGSVFLALLWSAFVGFFSNWGIS